MLLARWLIPGHRAEATSGGKYGGGVLLFRLFFLFLLLRPRLPLLVRHFFEVFFPLLPEPCPCLPPPGDTAPLSDKSTIARAVTVSLKPEITGNDVTRANLKNRCGFWHNVYRNARPARLKTRRGGCSLLSISCVTDFTTASGHDFQNKFRRKVLQIRNEPGYTSTTA